MKFPLLDNTSFFNWILAMCPGNVLQSTLLFGQRNLELTINGFCIIWLGPASTDMVLQCSGLWADFLNSGL